MKNILIFLILFLSIFFYPIGKQSFATEPAGSLSECGWDKGDYLVIVYNLKKETLKRIVIAFSPPGKDGLISKEKEKLESGGSYIFVTDCKNIDNLAIILDKKNYKTIGHIYMPNQKTECDGDFKKENPGWCENEQEKKKYFIKIL